MKRDIDKTVEVPAKSGKSLYSNGLVFAVAPMIDWTRIENSQAISKRVLFV